MFVNQPRLDLRQFQQTPAAANQHFAEIRKKYPTLRACLALLLPSRQTKLDGELADSIQEFHSLLLDSAAKTKALKLIKKLKPRESTKPKTPTPPRSKTVSPSPQKSSAAKTASPSSTKPNKPSASVASS